MTELQLPTGRGNLDKKVVILNSGHGGYQQSNGSFDPGTVLSVKNAEGKEMPIEEWRVAKSFVDKLSDDLRSRGATVIFVSGAVRNGGMAKQQYLENMLAGKKVLMMCVKLLKTAINQICCFYRFTWNP